MLITNKNKIKRMLGALKKIKLNFFVFCLTQCLLKIKNLKIQKFNVKSKKIKIIKKI